MHHTCLLLYSRKWGWQDSNLHKLHYPYRRMLHELLPKLLFQCRLYHFGHNPMIIKRYYFSIFTNGTDRIRTCIGMSYFNFAA